MITILEGNGLRSLHFGTPAVQGVMRLAKPYDIELEYVQQMMSWLLFQRQAGHIVQLGLGAASLTKYCHHYLAPARVTAVEREQEVIDTCRESFALPADDDRLTVLCMDAGEYVANPARRRSVDVLQIDLYDARAHSPALSSEAFYAACARCLTPDGLMTVNLYCDWPEHLEHIRMMETAFEAVAWLPEVHDGNIVAIAFKRAPSIDFEDLYERADQIAEALGLPAASWVSGLYKFMSLGTEGP